MELGKSPQQALEQRCSGHGDRRLLPSRPSGVAGRRVCPAHTRRDAAPHRPPYDEVSGWKGQDVVDPSGDKIGSYTKAQVKDAPNAEPDGLLSEQEEARLYEYYGLPYSDARSDTGLPETGSGYETLTAARLVALAVMLLAGWTGGRLGERYHRRADSLVARTRPGAVGRPQRVVRAS